MPSSSLLCNLDQLLAEVTAAQQSPEQLRSIFQPLTNGLTIFDLARLHPDTQLLCRFLPLVEPFTHHKKAMLGNGVSVFQNLERRLYLADIFSIVVGDITTDRYTRPLIQQRHYSTGHITTHILEVNINSMRTGRSQFLLEVAGFVINTFIKSELLTYISAFVLTAGNTHNMQPQNFGHL